MRDDGALRSAIAAPRNTWAYEDTDDPFLLAATYAYHITKAHAFVDGNKRTALVAALAFLDANGLDWSSAEDDLEAEIRGLSDGSFSKEAMAERFREMCSSV